MNQENQPTNPATKIGLQENNVITKAKEETKPTKSPQRQHSNEQAFQGKWCAAKLWQLIPIILSQDWPVLP